MADDRDQLARSRRLRPRTPKARRASGNPLYPQAMRYLSLIEAEMDNGEATGHQGRAFEEISYILARLENRISKLEP